jgi:hypothetical protein
MQPERHVTLIGSCFRCGTLGAQTVKWASIRTQTLLDTILYNCGGLRTNGGPADRPKRERLRARAALVVSNHSDVLSFSTRQEERAACRENVGACTFPAVGSG